MLASRIAQWTDVQKNQSSEPRFYKIYTVNVWAKQLKTSQMAECPCGTNGDLDNSEAAWRVLIFHMFYFQ